MLKIFYSPSVVVLAITIVIVLCLFVLLLIKRAYRKGKDSNITEHTGKDFKNRNQLTEEDTKLIDEYYQGINDY